MIDAVHFYKKKLLKKILELTHPVSRLFPQQSSVNIFNDDHESCHLGVTKRCRLSWLTNSALVYEPKYGVSGGELRGLSQ
jgi:hypothetical protein